MLFWWNFKFEITDFVAIFCILPISKNGTYILAWPGEKKRHRNSEQGEDLRMSEKCQLAKDKHKNNISKYYMEDFHIAEYILSN